MGLDITVYTKLKFIRRRVDAADSPEEYEHGHWICNDNRPEYARHVDGLEPGFYKAERVMNFRAGSYSGYNEWRNELSMIALGVSAREAWARQNEFLDKPLIELINFSDCEGMIGFASCQRLTEGFNSLDAKFPKLGYFAEKLALWREAALVAGGGRGCLDFH